MSERASERNAYGCLLVAHARCVTCESDVAIQECARRPNAIGQALHATRRRVARYVLRCLVGAAKRYVLVSVRSIGVQLTWTFARTTGKPSNR
jgi:hypothetical protein